MKCRLQIRRQDSWALECVECEGFHLSPGLWFFVPLSEYLQTHLFSQPTGWVCG